jgi:RNA polymerase sigma-70 factor (ECF subfamily)
MCELLLLRHRRGEEGALGELVSLWERPLFYYIRRFTSSESDAWDTLQQVWLQVVRRVETLRDPRAFPEWAYRIAHNAIVSRWRSEPSFNPLPEDSEVPDERSAETGAALHDLDPQDIHRALERLKPPHREVLTLFFLEEFSIDDIAGIVGVPQGTVKSRLHYAKVALRRILDDGELSHD